MQRRNILILAGALVISCALAAFVIVIALGDSSHDEIPLAGLVSAINAGDVQRLEISADGVVAFYADDEQLPTRTDFDTSESTLVEDLTAQGVESEALATLTITSDNARPLDTLLFILAIGLPFSFVTAAVLGALAAWGRLGRG